MTKRINIEKTRQNLNEKIASGYYKKNSIISSEIIDNDDDYDSISSNEALELLYGKENIVWEE